MGRFLNMLLAQPVAANDRHECELADTLHRGNANAGQVFFDWGATVARLAAIEHPSEELLARLAHTLEWAVSARRQAQLWREVQVRYPDRALVRLFALRARVSAIAADAATDNAQLEGATTEESDPGADEIRELYSELLEHYANHTLATDELHVIGRVISDLEARGQLPQVLIRRGSWRRPD